MPMVKYPPRRVKPTKPVKVEAHWVAPIAPPLAGIMSINDIGYSVEENRSRGRLLGYRLVNGLSGAVYDVNTSWDPEHWSCDCPDFLYRRQNIDREGCKHVRALREQLPLMPKPRPTSPTIAAADDDNPFVLADVELNENPFLAVAC